MSRAQAGARLLWEADPILVLVTQLRATTAVADLARLRARILAMLQEFQERARKRGIEAARVTQATDVLGALVDQVVTSMPWGAEAGWKSVGGSKSAGRPVERVLAIVRTSSSDAGMSELVNVALALGFDAERDKGAGPGAEPIAKSSARSPAKSSARPSAKPAAKASATPAAKRAVKPDASAELRLSPDATAFIARSKPWTSWLPLWVSTLVVAALLAVLFVVLVLSLGAMSDRVYAHMAALHGPAIHGVRQPAAEPRVAGVLAEHVAARDVFVRDEIDRSELVIPNQKLFATDDATLRPEAAGLLRAIATALQATPGRIQVIGHTDGTVAHSARYPSDWDLSVDRARTVRTALRNLGIDGSRIAFDGRANVEPLRNDDGARAVSGNGRVAIVLLVGR